VEIAAMMRRLVGTEGRYITGQTIYVNGGLYLAKCDAAPSLSVASAPSRLV
jgi:hypothetical protein